MPSILFSFLLNSSPQWDRCAQYIDGGQDKWNELSNGKSSDQVVDVLLAEIAGVSIDELIKSDVFDGKASLLNPQLNPGLVFDFQQVGCWA